MFKTFEKELDVDDANALKPLERVEVADGLAMPDEVVRIVANRAGAVLSASTILKSDFFSNLQKMSLPEYVPDQMLVSHDWPFISPSFLHSIISQSVVIALSMHTHMVPFFATPVPRGAMMECYSFLSRFFLSRSGTSSDDDIHQTDRRLAQL